MHVHENWSLLRDAEVTMSASVTGRALYLENLEFETALKIGHMLTLMLDAPRGNSAMYKPESYTYEQMLSTATSSGRTSFETRPDDRNLAVRVESRLADRFSITADVRNDYEDYPELGGAEKLQHGFVAAIEALEL